MNLVGGKRELPQLRREVAKKTLEIMKLVAQRNSVAKRIGDLKRSQGLPLDDEKVEEMLLAEVIRLSRKLGVDKRFAAKMLNSLISEAKRVQGQEDEGTIVTPMAVLARALQLEKDGRRVIRLDVGEPDFPPPTAVLDGCELALREHKTHYTRPQGIEELIEALRRHLRTTHHFEAGAEELAVTLSGRFAVYAAIATTVREGETAVIIEPCWPAYKEQIEYVGGRAISIQTTLEEGWEPEVERIKERIRPNTKVLVLNNPSNPTGKIVKPSVFREMVGVANDNHLTVISDEVYRSYSYAPCPSILDGGAERFILTSSFSKTWSMTGFRVGYAVSDKQTIGKIVSLASLMYTSVPEFIQHGAIKALESDEEAERNKKVMKERIEIACGELDRINELMYYRPDGAMYLFPQSRNEGFDSARFSTKLLDEKGVSVVPGTGFGNYPRCFRISLGSSTEVVAEGIRRIGEYLA